MGKRCEQKIELLKLIHKQRIEDINFDFQKELKEKDLQIEYLQNQLEYERRNK